MIKDNVRKILSELPAGVKLVAATKSRTVEEIIEAVDGGIKVICENYVQEAEKKFRQIGNRAGWHFAGHLQKNKARKAVEIFDMIQTLDSGELAVELDRRARDAGKVMPVLIEVNSGEEERKSGVFPGEVIPLAKQVACFSNIKVNGLFTMGPFCEDPEKARPYFARTRGLFEELKAEQIPGVAAEHLSMGMSSSFKVAIQEGANMVRIGTLIFGERE